jgi:hypothetical protein
VRGTEVEGTNLCKEENGIGRMLNLREWKEKCAWRGKQWRGVRRYEYAMKVKEENSKRKKEY